MKRLILFFGISLWIMLYGNSVLAQSQNKVSRVVIDAGHGGKDPGALGASSREKDITLAVALKAGECIREAMCDVEVIYTRKTDVFIELHRRAQIANESGADVFISIHCNSNKSSQPQGAETYVMGLHKTSENLDVAKTENAAIFYEEDYKDQYEGFDPNADEDYIILNMFQSLSLDQSINLGAKLQHGFREELGRKDRGVKQAGFWVLYKTTMPGILIELGFLSNPEEEKFLKSEEGQLSMARAICQALEDYKVDFESLNQPLKPIAVRKKEAGSPVIYYRVQFASYKKEKSIEFKKFRGLEDVRVYEHDGQYKYTVGNELTYEAALKLKQEMVVQGYKDIFIVAFLNEQRISLEEAKVLAENYNEGPK